jgi:hypothetical protein
MSKHAREVALLSSCLALGLVPGCSCSIQNNFSSEPAATSAPPPPAPASTIAAAPPPTDTMLACGVDDDCVAVPLNSCCPDGERIAVSAGSVDAYKASFTCPDAGAGCVVTVVPDPRQPRCGAVSRKCEMVAR